MAVPPGEATGRAWALACVPDPDDASLEAASRLTAHFPDFLPHFLRQTISTGGEVWTAAASEGLVGLLLLQVGERSATVFVDDPAVAEALLAGRGKLEVYSEIPLGRSPDRYGLFLVDLPPPPPPHRYAHPVRLAGVGDRTALLDLLHGAFGEADERWFHPLPAPPERGFVAEADGRVVGAAWVAAVGHRARLHSLAVHPRYRGLGVGRELWHARAAWAEAQGARALLAEISERNLASRAVARAGGMREVGEIYRTQWG